MPEHKAHRPARRAAAARVERHNPKAFTFSGGHVSVRRRVQRSAEVGDKRLKVATAADKAGAQAPPFVVVVQGPPGSGKTTLVKSLVKHYSKQAVAKLRGAPVTCVVSKARRLTFIECPCNDLAALLDLAKVADLAVCMIDARHGFELETLEFISIMQNHGLPRVTGVLSHLDEVGRAEGETVKLTTAVKKLKKALKNRLWAELYAGAKLFFLQGIRGSRGYFPRDLINLARHISTQRFDPLAWRSQHPYLLMLGLEVDQTSEDAQSDVRSVAFTGYVRGAPARSAHVYHIPGCGDFRVREILTPEDPCPLPANQKRELRKQSDAERRVYAPLCEIGTLSIEGNSIFVTFRDEKNEQQPRGLKKEESDDDNQTTSSTQESAADWDGDEYADVWSDEAAISEPEGVGAAEADLLKASEELRKLQDSLPAGEGLHEEDWSEIIYKMTLEGDPSWHQFMLNGHVDTSAKPLLKESAQEPFVDYWDGSKPAPEWLMASMANLVQAAGARDEADGEPADGDAADGDADGAADGEDSSFRMYGPPGLTVPVSVLKSIRGAFFATGGWDSGADPEESSLLLQDIGKLVTMDVEVTGDRSGWTIPVGTFVRIKLDKVPLQWLRENFSADRNRPVVIGGVKEEENRLAFLHARCRRHRWSPGVLKSSEPLLFSVGWRRFQALPYFAMEDRGNVRNRFLKYTPEHLHCQAYFHGFAAPPGTGLVAIKKLDRVLPREQVKSLDELVAELQRGRQPGKHEHYDGWRISLHGTVVEVLSGAPNVMKKLKFIGSVCRDQKLTAKTQTVFITGMFNSRIEVSRCLGVPIQTQAGVRGLIKKPHGDKGDFRATFEAPIMKNDVIVCKAWYRVPMEPFCNPQADVSSWDFLRPFAEVRAELGLQVDGSRPQSVYTSVPEREEAKDRGFRIPSKLKAVLPYEDLEVVTSQVVTAKDDLTGDLSLTKQVEASDKIKWTPYEQMVNALLKKVEATKSARLAKEQEALAKRVAAHERLSATKQAAYAEKHKEQTRAQAKKRGRQEQIRRKKMRLEV